MILFTKEDFKSAYSFARKSLRGARINVFLHPVEDGRQHKELRTDADLNDFQKRFGGVLGEAVFAVLAEKHYVAATSHINSFNTEWDENEDDVADD